ncbi:TlpA family protein disulfide reductase [Alkaliphilus pronyensis]|uniref:TlpA family protein disulfide reductase n=1 Tax=Alkaliphilus pronyensis TaxID=1482732 RepID=A0A6I0FC34_9FIRM|nr:TlpA disulfide reductase family protein [Alkaliphilus pronyensis]KAB3535310.1 TlpA family protein disulfide reductase [Alkaliphilus pronyensis]
MLKKTIIILLVAVAMVAYTGCNILEDNGSSKDNTKIEDTQNEELNFGSKENDKALDFTLRNLKGEEVSLRDYAGKKIILNFWSSECPPCREEMPALDEFHLSHDNIVVLGVNLGENSNTVKDFIQDGGYSFPILLDEKLSVAEDYGIIYMPTTFFINEEGIIEDIHVGLLTLEDLKEKFN